MHSSVHSEEAPLTRTDLSPSQITFLTTSKCTARCAHCSVSSGPERRDKLTFEMMKATVDQLLPQGRLKLVIFAGGEPTLLGRQLLDTIAYCDVNGLVTRLVTNASWASTPETARRKVQALRNAGLAELNISADDYHLPYIPFENVMNAWHAAHGQGFSAVIIANCYGPKSMITPEYIKARLGGNLPETYDGDGYRIPLAARSNDGTAYGLSNAFLQNIGRARRELKLDVFFGAGADEEMMAGGCPWAIQSAAVSPKNHLVACCGMEAEHNYTLDFGDLETDTAPSLLQKANRDVVMMSIARLGPAFLKRFLRDVAPDVELAREHHSMCELCEEIVTSAAAQAALRKNAGRLAMHVLRVEEETAR